jgi:hypothetical protein
VRAGGLVFPEHATIARFRVQLAAFILEMKEEGLPEQNQCLFQKNNQLAEEVL